MMCAISQRRQVGTRAIGRLAIDTLAIGTLALALIAGAGAANAAEPPSAVIVFDGSGSMWGKLDGDAKRTKLDLARDGLKAALAKVPATARYGLMSFGHRRAADCSDIQLLVPLADGDPSRINVPLEKHNPRGKGPIAGVIREAAKVLAGVPNAHVVLIHDNVDNCRQDACEAARDVARAEPKLKFHLVPIGIDPEERDRIACIATATGGSIHDVADPAKAEAQITKAIQLALIDPGGAVAGPEAGTGAGAAASSTAATAGRPSSPIDGPGLVLSAVLAKGRPLPSDVPVRWRITKAGAIVHQATGQTLAVKLEPASYAIEVEAGLARLTTKADVTAGSAAQMPVSLEAARVAVAVRQLADAPISPTAIVTVAKAADGAGAAPIWIGRASDARLIIPAGAYKVTVRDSLVTVQEAVEVAAGATVEKAILTRAGRLEIKAAATAAGDALPGATVLIARDDPEAPDGRREIARSASPEASFVVPAGTYYVTARMGAASRRERVAVGAGDTVKQTIVLGLARLAVAAATPSAIPGSSASGAAAPVVRTRILSLDGEAREVARSTAPSPEFLLSPGRYRVEASIGGQNVKAVQDIDLAPNAERRLTPRLDAALVAVRLAGAGATADVAWEVFDPRGERVTRSLDPAPRFVLVPGRYKVRVESRGKVAEASFDAVANGQLATVDVAVP
jgi:Ca-activated chloride channel family protein